LRIFALWRAHPNLSSPIETVTSIRNSLGTWVRSDEDGTERRYKLLRSTSLRTEIASKTIFFSST